MMNRPKAFTIVSILTGSLGLAASAADWPQYRGPNHDGTSPEKIATKWPETGPRAVWKVPLKDGFSSMTLGGGKVFTLVARSVEGANQETCVALDANTGQEVWAAPLGIAKYDGGGDSGAPGNNGGDGPRSTPSFDNGKVYTYSSRMILKCMDAASGKEIWSVNVPQNFGGQNITWQSAASPLIEGDLVYIVGGGAGQSLLAFNKADGKVAWRGQSDGLTHSTPVATTIHGQRQIIFYTQKGLVSVVPASGQVLWRFATGYKGSTATSPVVSGDTVYCSSAYGIGTAACKITKNGDTWSATQLWQSPGNTLANHWGTPVTMGGYVYGIYGQAQFGKAPLKCVDIATGQVKWSKDGFGPGGITLVDGNLAVLNDAGELVLVKGSPMGYTEIARSRVLTGKCWNSVGISNGRVYARSTKQGVCLDLSPNEMARE